MTERHVLVPEHLVNLAALARLVGLSRARVCQLRRDGVSVLAILTDTYPKKKSGRRKVRR